MTPDVPVPDLLFVYGTLRPTLAHLISSPDIRRLVARLPEFGKATITGRIHDLGLFPGLVMPSGTDALTQDPASLVTGDLLLVDEQALASLDLYEECTGPRPLYRREQVVAVRQADGRTVRAWTYVSCEDISTAPPIDGGDYASYVSRRGDIRPRPEGVDG